jgi:hypothetical protein
MRLEVDYAQHPAFAPFVKSGASADSFAGIFDLIDGAIATQVDGHDSKGVAVAEARANIRRLIDEDPNIESTFKPFVAAAFDRAVDRCTDEEARRRGWGRGSAGASEEARRRAEQILEQGYTAYRMPPEDIREVRQLLMPDIERLRRSLVDLPDDVIITPPTNSAARDIIKKFCEEAGVFEALSTYYGHPYRDLGFAIHLSHPKDTWFRQFDDIGLEMPQTAQMHFDLSFEHPKAMLYLNDVSEKQGPFSAVQKTDPWEWFGSELAFRKEVLYAVAYFTAEIHGQTVTGNRSVLRLPGARRIFASLPPSLRRLSHAGDHILDGTDLSRRLLRAETRLVGEAGLMPIFAGSHVLHRGGLVAEGERWALQIVFPPAVPEIPAPSESPGIVRKLARGIRSIHSRLSS